MNRFFTVRKIALYILLMLGGIASADIDGYEFSTSENQKRYLDLTRELRCPKCQNQDIADSNAPIAQDMRAQVHRLVEEGKSHEQVVDFMIERFGDFVTYKPKMSNETMLLWYGPWVFIVIGVVAIVLIARKKNNTNQSQESNNKGVHDRESPPKSKVQDLLDRYTDD